MREAVAKLLPLLNALTAEERAEITNRLATLNGEEGDEELTPEEWEAAWVPEIDRRIEDAQAGKTVGMPADEFMRRMREKHG